jgi:hypothetical protein
MPDTSSIYLSTTATLAATKSSYISTLVTFPTNLSAYLSTNTTFPKTLSSYLSTDVSFPKTLSKYLDTTATLVSVRSLYLSAKASLQEVRNVYLSTRILLAVELSPYEVDEFQVIVSRQFVDFYWKDSSPGLNKTYTIYDSIDSGITWNLIATTKNLTYQMSQVPYDIPNRIYKVTITTGPTVSFGTISYPCFSFRRILNSLDNGYWDVDPVSNIYMLEHGIAKEAHSRAELEIDYTQQDESILNIRKSRISDVYGIPFSQTTLSADEEYRRKIWNLFLGFRNTSTYEGVYSVVKAFTHIPPRITSLTEAYGWYLGTKYLGVDTIPLLTLASNFGVRFDIHMYQNNAGIVDTTDTTSVFNAISTVPDGFNPINNYYKDQFLVFKTGQNRGSSRQILSSSALPPPHDSTTRFITNPFTIADTSANNTFFVTNVSTDTIEQYVREAIPLHTNFLFLFFSDYITENQDTKFSGTFKNMEVIPSDRLRVNDVSVLVDDEGKQVQAVYESGFALSSAFPLSSFGANGIVCWDDIEWGDSGTNLKMYMSFTPNLVTPTWVYQSGITNFVTFTTDTEKSLSEYIIANSETVAVPDTTSTFVRNVDYVMDYRAGTIRRTLTSSIPFNTVVSVKYSVEWGQVTQNQSLSFGAGQNYFKYKFVVNGLVDRDAFEFSGFYIKKLVT